MTDSTPHPPVRERGGAWVMAVTEHDSRPWTADFSLRVAATWDGKPVAPSDFVDFAVRLADDKLELTVTAPFYGDPPPASPAGECDRLWEYEVVELFLLGPGGHYLEIELGPHGHYLILSLNGIRQIDKKLQPRHCATQVSGSRWQATLSLDRDLLPLPLSHANAYAIHGQGTQRRYLASFAVPGARPDFHQPLFFGALARLPVSS